MKKAFLIFILILFLLFGCTQSTNTDLNFLNPDLNKNSNEITEETTEFLI